MSFEGDGYREKKTRINRQAAKPRFIIFLGGGVDSKETRCQVCTYSLYGPEVVHMYLYCRALNYFFFLLLSVRPSK